MRVRPLVMVLLCAALGVLALLAAWAIDGRRHRDEVLPNVVVADQRVRGMKAGELEALVQAAAAQFSQANVVVQVGETEALQATVPELGVTVDGGRTVADVLAVGRSGSVAKRLWEWARSFIRPVRVPVAIQVDRRTMDRVVGQRDKARTPPVEPNLVVKDGRLDGVAGKNGRGVSPTELAEALTRVEPASDTLLVTTELMSVPPRFSQADAEQLAAEGERLAAAGLAVTAGGQTATIPAESLRNWLQAVPGDTSLQLALKGADDIGDDIVQGLAELLPDAGTRPTNAGFTVSGGRVTITASRSGTACCAPEAVQALNAALLDPALRAKPVELPLKSVAPERDEEAARKLGIVEEVATFTTPHAAGEPRVTNIHLMADTIRGTVIPPGGTLSINGIVGMRTKAKGYVEAPIISADYKFESDVGGGVSQFATTMFNAAFFAGLEITEYYMHGLYIARYPYGREATLSYPSPDLKVQNQTPHGVLVWPTYTGSSITVTLYSTKYFASVEQSGQRVVESQAKPPADAPPETPAPGPCATVRTDRTRTYLDGRTSVDRFSAVYAPAEGWSCPSAG